MDRVQSWDSRATTEQVSMLQDAFSWLDESHVPLGSWFRAVVFCSGVRAGGQEHGSEQQFAGIFAAGC
eukprot:11178359-Lingulodinium_polyedra.AAC.1